MNVARKCKNRHDGRATKTEKVVTRNINKHRNNGKKSNREFTYQKTKNGNYISSNDTSTTSVNEDDKTLNHSKAMAATMAHTNGNDSKKYTT